MRKSQKIRFTRVWLGLCLMVVATIFMSFSGSKAQAGKKEEVLDADLRFIFTTDIHGQLNSTDYELGTDYKNGGLARAFSLIKQARSEQSNSFTFDVGDVLYDYTTEYIYANNQKIVQPIYEAMSKIGYDAMTLGNHEFDYEYDYLRDQLTKAGLMDKMVVSNLTDSKTGEYPFKENMLLTKKVKTNTNKTVNITVGVVGETLPYLSKKEQDFTGVLNVEDIVENVKVQAAKLKAQGADIVVVLAHSGMGSETPVLGDTNEAYALTKIDDVDVVLCGHEHNEFPSDDKSSKYYQLPGVDKTTGLVNGKNIVMAPDRCKGIGVVDLGLHIVNGKVEIVNRKSEVRKVTEKNSIEEKSISMLYDDLKDAMLEYTKKQIGQTKENDVIENYNGLVQDNSAIQLLNDAKRAYALRYIHTKGESYINTPVIAASTYVSYGANSFKDFVNITGGMTESDLAGLQKYNGYTAIYKITGAQLKEWLEWSASAYEQINVDTKWTNSEMLSYMNSTKLKPLVSEEWMDDWSSFYVFDGIDYTINPMIAPRYNIKGVKVNGTNRVTNITYNGQTVTDDQTFVLAIGKIVGTNQISAPIKKQGIYKGYVKTQGVIRDYIKERCKLGNLVVTPDYNWTIDLPKTYEFLTKTTELGENKLSSTSWFEKKLGVLNHYVYSIGSYKTDTTKESPSIIVTSTNSDITSTKVRVAVSATARNGLKELKYVRGDFKESNPDWALASNIKDNYFFASENGIYTIYAKDLLGNITIEKINIDNIYANSLGKPKVNTYSNRMTKISGKADVSSTVVIEAGGTTYTTKADGNGTFSYALPAQKSGAIVTLYAMNEEKNVRSEVVTVKVKRTGPNKPTVYGAYNNSDKVFGNLNDDDSTMIAFVDDTVYVGNEDAANRYKNCADLYNKKYKVVVTNIEIEDDLEYALTVPAQPIGTKIKLVGIDHVNRKSMAKTVTVADAGPNAPVIYDLTSIDMNIYGSVTSSKANTIFTVFISIGDDVYEGKTDKNGDFAIPVPEGTLKNGEEISVYATDNVNNTIRMSQNVKVKIKNPDKYLQEENDLTIDELYAGNTTINGENEPNEDLFIAVLSNGSYKVYQVTADDTGSFEVDLETPLKSKDTIYGYTRLSYGGIIDMVKTGVELTKPEQPTLKSEITNNTKTVTVYTDVDARVVLKVGKKTYESKESTYNESLDIYVHKISITKPAAKENIQVYAYNNAGKSKVNKATVTKVVPNAPKVSAVKEDAVKISGKVDVIGDTTIHAKIGSKEYTGKVAKSGTYTIKVPKQKAGASITVWGENETGSGEKTTVKVQKK